MNTQSLNVYSLYLTNQNTKQIQIFLQGAPLVKTLHKTVQFLDQYCIWPWVLREYLFAQIIAILVVVVPFISSLNALVTRAQIAVMSVYGWVKKDVD